MHNNPNNPKTTLTKNPTIQPQQFNKSNNNNDLIQIRVYMRLYKFLVHSLVFAPVPTRVHVMDLIGLLRIFTRVARVIGDIRNHKVPIYFEDLGKMSLQCL